MKARFKFVKLNYFALVLLAVTGSTFAAKPAKPRPKRSSDFPLLQPNTIKVMIDVTAKQIGRRYDLTPEQADIAREMLETSCWDYIETHFDDLAELLPQMHRMRFSQKDPSPTEVQAWAKRFAPLFKDAADLIVSENMKFHEILDDKQKKKHERDLRRMRRDIKRMTRRLDRWKTGGYRAGEMKYGLSGPRRRRGKRPSPRPPQPREQKTELTSFDFWEDFVRKFIDAFQLDPGQRTFAYSILSDKKAEAQAYRRDRAAEFAEVLATIKRLSKKNTTKPAESQALKEAKNKLAELNQPLIDMFNELREKLIEIPTEEQRRAALRLLGEEEPQQTQPTTKPSVEAQPTTQTQSTQ